MAGGPALRRPWKGSLAGGDGEGLPRGFWLAVAAGLALRLWYFLDLRVQPWYGFPVVDALTYDGLARGILAQGHPGGYFRPPLYPYFLAGAYALFGARPGPVAAVQFLLGLGALPPAFLLARRWFGGRAAVAGAWLAALHPLRIFFEGELLDVTLFSFLFLWGAWLLWRGIEEGSPRCLLWAGLLWGWGILARPNLVLALPCAAAGGLLGGRARGRGALVALLPWAAGVAFGIAPATLHNWVAERALIPVAGNGGVNFFLGNEAGATGLTPLPPGLRWEHAMQEPVRLGLVTLGAQERYWWRRARQAVLDAPAGWLALLAKKAALFWNAAEPSNNKALPHFTGVSFPVRHYEGWWGLLVVLAAPVLLSLPRCSGEERKGAVFLRWLTAGFSVSVVLFFVTARYRLPLVPLLAGAAGAGWTALCDRVRARRWGAAAGLVTAFALVAVGVLPDWFDARRERISADFQMGQIHLMRGEPGKAREYLLRARAADPRDPDVLNSLGAAYLALGLPGRAEESYRAALSLGEFSEVWYNLGVVAERAGPARRAEALAAYRRALAINPLERRAQANLEYLQREARPPGT